MSDHNSPPRETIIRAVSPAVEFRDASETDLEDGHLGLLRVLFSPVNEWTEIRSAWEGNFMERFAPGAWKKTISESRSKIRALFQHGQDPQVGDKPLGPIHLIEENERGGYAEVALLDTSYNRDLLPSLKAGLYGASHRFSVMREEEVSSPKPSDSNPHGLPERTIKEAKLMEFGPVTFPAYEGATAGVRSLTDEFLMSAIRMDPAKAREMFAKATTLGEARMDSEDVGTLAEMLALASTYIEEQDEEDAAEMAALAAMQGIQGELIKLLNVEAVEDEPDEPEDDRAAGDKQLQRTQETKDAPSEDDAEPIVAHLADARREDKPPHKGGPSTAHAGRRRANGCSDHRRARSGSDRASGSQGRRSTRSTPASGCPTRFVRSGIRRTSTSRTRSGLIEELRARQDRVQASTGTRQP
jgi:HK97 family phage prohead protease